MLMMIEIMVKGTQEPSSSLFKSRGTEGRDFYLERELEIPVIPRIGERFSTPALQSVQECHGKVQDVLWITRPDGTVRNRVYVHYDMHVHGAKGFQVASALQAEGWDLAADPHLEEIPV